MKTSVIGANGFVGRSLVRRLRGLGHEVDALDCDTNAESDVVALDVVEGTVRFPEGTDAVFYLAQSPRYRDLPAGIPDLIAVNALGAVKAAAEAARTGVKFFCYASSGNVYQPSFYAHDESSPTQREEAYALSKCMGEEGVRLFAGSLSVLSVRLFGVFGPGQKTMLPWHLRRRILAGDSIRLEPALHEGVGSEGLRVSFSFLDDVVDILVALATRGVSGSSIPGVLNVAGPEPVSLRRFGEAMGRALGSKPCFEVAEAQRTFDLVADISQLQALLDPLFTPLDEAVARSFG